MLILTTTGCVKFTILSHIHFVLFSFTQLTAAVFCMNVSSVALTLLVVQPFWLVLYTCIHTRFGHLTYLQYSGSHPDLFWKIEVGVRVHLLWQWIRDREVIYSFRNVFFDNLICQCFYVIGPFELISTTARKFSFIRPRITMYWIWYAINQHCNDDCCQLSWVKFWVFFVGWWWYKQYATTELSRVVYRFRLQVQMKCQLELSQNDVEFRKANLQSIATANCPGDVAQMVERLLSMWEVGGSIPVRFLLGIHM